MSGRSDAEWERLRAASPPTRQARFDPSLPALLGRVTGASPAGGRQFVVVEDLIVSGDEVEGGAGALAATGNRRLVAFLAPPPPAGTVVLVQRVARRWVARWTGAGMVEPTCPVCVRVESCSVAAGPIEGATVSLTDGTNTWAGTTDASGRACFDIAGGPDLTATIMAPGYLTLTGTFTADCRTEAVAVLVPTTYDVMFCVEGVCRCDGINRHPLPGATVTLTATGGGGGGATGTTGPDGCVTLTLPGPAPGGYTGGWNGFSSDPVPGELQWTVDPPASPPGYAPASGTGLPPGGPVIGQLGCDLTSGATALSTDADHLCHPACGYPVRKTLDWTDDHGGCVLFPYVLGGSAVERQPADGDDCVVYWLGAYQFLIPAPNGAAPDSYGVCQPSAATVWAVIQVGTTRIDGVWYWQVSRSISRFCQFQCVDGDSVPQPGLVRLLAGDTAGLSYDQAISPGELSTARSAVGLVPITCDPNQPINETVSLKGPVQCDPPTGIPGLDATGTFTESA